MIFTSDLTTFILVGSFATSVSRMKYRQNRQLQGRVNVFTERAQITNLRQQGVIIGCWKDGYIYYRFK